MKLWIIIAGLALLSIALVGRSVLPAEAAKQCGTPSANQFPLKVYISPNGEWSNDVSATRFRELAIEAIENWAALPDSAISYVVTTDYRAADVGVYFRSTNGAEHGRGFCARTSPGQIHVNAGHNEPGHWDTDESNGVLMTAASVESILTHEFGHMLGLDHNCDDAGIMCVSLAKDADGHNIGQHGKTTVISPLEQAMVASFYPASGVTPTNTVAPTSTPQATATSTLVPTNTPQPTNTPGSNPTMTPTPASTPVPWWCRLWPRMC